MMTSKGPPGRLEAPALGYSPRAHGGQVGASEFCPSATQGTAQGQIDAPVDGMKTDKVDNPVAASASASRFKPPSNSHPSRGIRTTFTEWLDSCEAWECVLGPSVPCGSRHARDWWTVLAEFCHALHHHSMEPWIHKLRRQKRFLLAWQAEELFGWLGAGREHSRHGRTPPSAKRHWREMCTEGLLYPDTQAPTRPSPLTVAPSGWWRSKPCAANSWLQLLQSGGRPSASTAMASVLSWNLGPLGYSASASEVEQLLEADRPLICLQDLRLSKRNAESVKRDIEARFPQYKIFVSSGCGRSADSSNRNYQYCVLTALHRRVFSGATSEMTESCPSRSRDRRSISTGRLLILKTLLLSGEEVFVINVYQFTASRPQEQEEMLRLLQTWLSRHRSKKILLVGDLNASASRVDPTPEESNNKALTCPDRIGYSSPLARCLRVADDRLRQFIQTSGGDRIACTQVTWVREAKAAALDHAITWNLVSDDVCTTRRVPGGYDHRQLLVALDASLLYVRPERSMSRTSPRLDPVFFNHNLATWKRLCTKRGLDEIGESTPSSQMRGTDLYRSYQRKTRLMLEIGFELQEKDLRRRRRARERPPDRSRQQREWHRRIRLLQAALRDALSAKYADRLPRATAVAIELLVGSSISVRFMHFIRSTGAWQDKLQAEIVTAKRTLNKITASLRKERNHQILSKFRWVFDHAVKGMRRLMGRQGSQVSLNAACHKVPIGISWKYVAPALPDQSCWPPDSLCAPNTQINIQDNRLLVTTSALSEVAQILEVCGQCPPPVSTEPSLVYSEGPWSDENLPFAVESFFQRNALSPFATCPTCAQGNPITVTACARATPSLQADRMTPTGMHNQHPSSRSVAAEGQAPSATRDSSRTRAPEFSHGKRWDDGERKMESEMDASSERRLLQYCGACMKFENFRHNRKHVKDMTWMTQTGIFDHHTIPTGETIMGPTTLVHFDRILKRMPNRRSPGRDGVPAEVLKNAPRSFQLELKALVDEVMSGSYLLEDEVLESKVVLLYKKGGHELISNYRPVALLTSLYQLTNLVITDRLQELTERYCVLQSGQYGFRRNRSVQMSAQRLSWLFKQARKSGGVLLQINLDFRNAFNAAGHASLWAILESFGVPDLGLIQNLYEASDMRILADGRLTGRVVMDTGTAQGSTLSPLLFDLFINALLRLLESSGVGHEVLGVRDFNHLAFADDLSLLVSSEKDADFLLKIVLQFEQWSGLSIASSKSFITGSLFGRGSDQLHREGRDRVKRRRRQLKAAPHSPWEQLAWEIYDRDQGGASVETFTRHAPHTRVCSSCKKTLSQAYFEEGDGPPCCLLCQSEWTPRPVTYNMDIIPNISGKQATRFLGVHGNLLGDYSEQIAQVFEKTIEILVFLASSPLTRRQNLTLIQRGLESTFRFSAGIVPWSENNLLKLDRMWMRAYRTAWGLSNSTPDVVLRLPRTQGGLQVRTPLSVLVQTLWTHLAMCVDNDDGLKELAFLEYEEALRAHHCQDLVELQAEAATMTWNQSIGNRFTHACFLTHRLNNGTFKDPPTLKLSIHWSPFHTASIWMTSSERLGELLVAHRMTFQVNLRFHRSLRYRCGSLISDPTRVRAQLVSQESTATQNPPPQEIYVFASPPRGAPNDLTIRELISLNWPAAKTVPELLSMWGTVAEEPARAACISWSRGTLPMRLRRRTLQESETRSETEEVELSDLIKGEQIYQRVLPYLIAAGYTSFDQLPRKCERINPSGTPITRAEFFIPLVKGRVTDLSPPRRQLLAAWLSRRGQDDWAALQLDQLPATPTRLLDLYVSPTAQPPAPPPVRNLHMAVNKIRRCQTLEAARTWWEEWLPTLDKEAQSLPEADCEAIVQKIQHIWSAPEHWKSELEAILDSFGALLPDPCPGRMGKRKYLEDRPGSADPAALGRNLIQRVLAFRPISPDRTSVQGSALHREMDCLGIASNVEFLCELRAPSRARLQELLDMPDHSLRSAIISGTDILCLPKAWWSGPWRRSRHMVQPHKTTSCLQRLDGWWVSGRADLLLYRCFGCGEFVSRPLETNQNQRCPACSAAKAPLRHSIAEIRPGVLLRTVEPELLETNLGGDTALTTEKLRECLKTMVTSYEKENSRGSIPRPRQQSWEGWDVHTDEPTQPPPRSIGRNHVGWTKKERESDNPASWRQGWFTSASLGHPIIDDGYDRPIHPEILRFIADHNLLDDWFPSWVRPYLEWHANCGGVVDGVESWVAMADLRVRKREWEQFAVPLIARNPARLPYTDIPDGPPSTLIQRCGGKGVVRVLDHSVVHELDWLSTKVTIFENIAHGTSPYGCFTFEGAKWYVLRQLVAPRLQEDFVPQLLMEIEWQKKAELRKSHMSYSWPVLRAAQAVFSARVYQGGSMVSSPPFFDAVGRDGLCFWGDGVGPTVYALADWSDDTLPALQTRLAEAQDWLILTPPVKSSSKRGSLLQQVGTRFCTSSGNATRVRGWWKSGCDQCVSNSTKTEVWIPTSTAGLSADIRARLAQLEECLGSTGKKESWCIGSSLGENLYLQGSEAGLLGAWKEDSTIVAYAGDGSFDKGVMGAGVYCLTTGNSLSARVGRETEGGSSNRPEHGAACLALRDARDDDRTLVCVSDSENMLSSIERWIGEGSLLCLHHHKDDDILREILELLHHRISHGWATVFLKVKSHRGEPCNELADRAADVGRSIPEAQWNQPSGRMLFRLTDTSADGHSTVRSTTWGPRVKRTIRMLAAYHVPKRPKAAAPNYTAAFLGRKDGSQDLLGSYLADKKVHESSVRRLLQSLTNQFPCNAVLFRNNMVDSALCSHCVKADPHSTQRETMGHIQCWCPSLSIPRTAAHHSIWRLLLTMIKQHSRGLAPNRGAGHQVCIPSDDESATSSSSDDEGSDVAEEQTTDDTMQGHPGGWIFPSADSEIDHKEYTIGETMSLVSDQCKDDIWLTSEAEQFLVSRNAIHLFRKEGQTDRAAATSFLNRRPDGLAIRQHQRQIALLEFTRAMDQDEQYQSRKEEEKDERYRLHRDFIQSTLEKLSGNSTEDKQESWRVKQINFTVGVRGHLHTKSFQQRLRTLGVSSLKSQEKIRKAVVRRALEVHDLMLKCYYQAKFGPPDRDWDSLALIKARATSLPSSSQSTFVHFLSPP